MPFLELIIIILSYLFGSINSAIIVCKLLRLPSPRSVGSGNPGTTNVLRLGGKKAAFFTLVGDLVKGLIPVLLAHLLQFQIIAISIVAFAAVLGHIAPIFFNFKGGKGVATLIGVILGLNIFIGLAFIITWLVIAALTRYSSLAAIIATIETPFIVYYFYNVESFIVFLLLAIIILVRHKDNITRLITQQENKIGSKK
jgi:acyl phosphate:glycerol-3-phosphate acyltransferase